MKCVRTVTWQVGWFLNARVIRAFHRYPYMTVAAYQTSIVFVVGSFAEERYPNVVMFVNARAITVVIAITVLVTNEDISSGTSVIIVSACSIADEFVAPTIIRKFVVPTIIINVS